MGARPNADMGIRLAVGLTYFLAAQLGFVFAIGAEQVSVVWPAAGVALAVVLYYGPRIWPAIAAGALAANLLAHAPFMAACAIALGNTAEALLGAWLLRRIVRFQPTLERLQDVLGLVVLAAGTSTMASATIGVTSLCLFGTQSWRDYSSLWWTWWLGDAIGILVVAPVLLTWSHRGQDDRRSHRPAEAILLGLALCSFSAIAFLLGGNWPGFDFPLNYLILPLVIWAGLRFGARGSATATFVSLGIALAATSRQWEPLIDRPLNEDVILLPVYMIMVSTTGLLFAAIAAERRRDERRLALDHHVTRVLAESSSIPEAMRRLLEAVCRDLEWEFGAAWLVDERAGVLRAIETWCRPGGACGGFRAVTERATFAQGDGLPGRVWRLGRWTWIDDVQLDASFTRATEAQRTGLRSAFGFPIAVRERLIGVIEFYSGRLEQPDRELLDSMNAVGAQTGLYVERSRAQEGLRRHEQELTEFLENAAIGIQSIAPDGTICWANRATLELLGYAVGEYQGRHIAEFHVDPESAARMLAGLARGEMLTDYEVDLRASDGSVRHVLISSSPHPEQARGVLARCFLRDFTDRKRTEEATRFLADAGIVLAALVDPDSTLEEMAKVAVPTFADWCVVRMGEPDGSLRTVAINHSDEAKTELARTLYYHYPPDPEYPYGAHRILRSGEPVLVSTISDELLSQAARDAEHARMLRELGLTSYIGVPLRVRGQTVGVVVFGTAESRRRFHAADLAVAEELARRASIALENAQLYAEVRAADRRKDEFLALLAHELRNPLAPICNALEIFKLAGADADAMRSARDLIDRQVQQLVRLVDDLLDLSRIMQGKIELRPERVELASIVRRALETAIPALEAGGHRLDTSWPEAPLYVDADPVRLVQIFANLLNNAAKYTERGGRIGLVCERDGSSAVVRVRDSGIGIPAHLLTPIFEPFFQADHSTDKSQGGMGMGLTLARRLAELHGGSIRAVSDGLGKGSEFTVRLPLGADSQQTRALPIAPRAAASVENAPPRKRTLVVDDNADVAQSLAMLLRLKGQDVRVAYDGRTAIDAALNDPPEFVFLDIGMPGMDGFEVARQLRAEPALQPLVLVAMTGWGQEEDRRRTHEAGFDYHLVKPASLADVEQVLMGTYGAGASAS